MTNNGKKSFWTTLPGILSGIAAIITAIAALYVAFNGLTPPVVEPTPPVVEPTPPVVEPTPPVVEPTPTPDEISGTYLMDHRPDRIITITHLEGNTYRVGESTSPWPWTGTVTVNEGRLSGSGMFIDSEASMNLEGFIQEDGSIVIQAKFINEPGRIDSHVWYPE